MNSDKKNQATPATSTNDKNLGTAQGKQPQTGNTELKNEPRDRPEDRNKVGGDAARTVADKGTLGGQPRTGAGNPDRTTNSDEQKRPTNTANAPVTDEAPDPDQGSDLPKSHDDGTDH